MRKLRYEELFPHEMEEIMAKTPIAYLPFGTLEWHGPHLALGNDALKAHEICLRVAKKAGGVVVPPTFWAIGGMPHPWTTRFDADLMEKLFYAIFEQLSHVGFRVIIALTGHYDIKQCYSLKKVACDFMYKSDVLIFPVPEIELAWDKGYQGDHAGKWETSILWALRPELVDMKRLDKGLNKPLEGVSGEDPRVHASKQLGEKVVNVIVDRLTQVARRLLTNTTALDRSKFIEILGFQVKILRERRWKLGTEEYGRFLDLFWKGEYAEANRVIKLLLKEEKQAFVKRMEGKLKRVLKKKTKT
jgi:creatinine amidohydrolase